MSIDQRLARIGHELDRIQRKLDFLLRVTIEHSPASGQDALLERLSQELDASSAALEQSVEDATTESHDPK